MNITEIVQKQKAYFRAGNTRPCVYRELMLQRLYQEIKSRTEEIQEALKQDLGKSSCEAYMTEIGLVLNEIQYHRRHIRGWMKKRKVPSSLLQLPGRSYVMQEPYGVVLVMSPWNYPFLLTMEPLIGAISAGNCCVVKPSAYAPCCSRMIQTILEESFPPDYVCAVQGAREINRKLLEERFDYIFFTGGKEVGRLVMEKASANLTPVTLELGGKSPCIVDKTADLKTAARRIVFGKFTNSGQTCVAPDYLMVQSRVKDRLLQYLMEEIKKQWGKRPLENPSYPRIVQRKHFERLCAFLKEGKAVTEIVTDEQSLKIGPTLLDGITWEDSVMQEEIFGPILPILEFETIEELIALLKEKEKPLALYLFTGSKAVEEKITGELSYGGGCINDTLLHLASPYMGFGGVGSSGMGRYHGKHSFDTFSHEKGILKKSLFFDLPIRYQPYTEKKEKILKLLLK